MKAMILPADSDELRDQAMRIEAMVAAGIQPDRFVLVAIAAGLRQRAASVARMERTLDEIVRDAAEDDALAQCAQVINFNRARRLRELVQGMIL